MTPSIKTLWVEALRSGRYTQGQLLLRNGSDNFCCLGVLCDVVKDSIGGHWQPSTGKTYFNFIAPDKSEGAAGPSPYVLTAIDLPKHTAMHLIRMNDEESKSFAEIADWIEENL